MNIRDPAIPISAAYITLALVSLTKVKELGWIMLEPGLLETERCLELENCA